MKISIELKPTFITEKKGGDEDEDWTEIFDYSKLPVSVQEEVLQFMLSDEFIKGQVEEYVLESIQCQFNGIVDDIKFYLENKTKLVVVIFATLTRIAHEDSITRCGGIDIIRIPSIESYIRDGFHKASHSGPITQKYGEYLGEDKGKYLIRFDYDSTCVSSIPPFYPHRDKSLCEKEQRRAGEC